MNKSLVSPCYISVSSDIETLHLEAKFNIQKVNNSKSFKEASEMNQNHSPPPPQQFINRVYESLLGKTNCKEDFQTSSAAWEKQKQADVHRENKDK